MSLLREPRQLLGWALALVAVVLTAAWVAAGRPGPELSRTAQVEVEVPAQPPTRPPAVVAASRYLRVGELPDREGVALIKRRSSSAICSRTPPGCAAFIPGNGRIVYTEGEMAMRRATRALVKGVDG